MLSNTTAAVEKLPRVEHISLMRIVHIHKPLHGCDGPFLCPSREVKHPAQAEQSESPTASTPAPSSAPASSSEDRIEKFRYCRPPFLAPASRYWFERLYSLEWYCNETIHTLTQLVSEMRSKKAAFRIGAGDAQRVQMPNND